MESCYQKSNTFFSQPVKVLVKQSDKELKSAPATDICTIAAGKGNLYGELIRYDEIWAKMMMMCRKLRHMMNEYNAQRYAQAWALDVNALTKTRDGIEKTFQAAMISAGGGLASSMCALGGAGSGFRAVKNLKTNPKMGMNNLSISNYTFNQHQSIGHDSGQFINSGCAAGASCMTKEADTAKAEAGLMNKSAHTYENTQDELQTQAKDIMRQMVEMGQKYVEQYSQALQYLVK